MHDYTRMLKLLHKMDGRLESCEKSLKTMEGSCKQQIRRPAHNPSKQKSWITAKTAGELINVDRKTIEAYARAGKIRREKVNGLWHYRKSDVLKYDKRTEEQKKKGR